MHFLADQVRIFAKCLREVGDSGVIDGCAVCRRDRPRVHGILPVCSTAFPKMLLE